MMEQVILNLVVNARDAMPGGGQLRVVTERVQLGEEQARLNLEARAGELVCLTISDTGTGIAPEVLPRIFEPFFTTKDVGKGTGRGLATVYGIVKQHQGWIEVSSEVGKGTTFRVFIPTIPTPARQTPITKAGVEIRGGTETILLVEDDHAVRLTTRRMLESRGYKVQEATCGREALELWHRHAGEIALLLTDLIMPEEMTGRDLAEQLWRQRPRLKVVINLRGKIIPVIDLCLKFGVEAVASSESACIVVVQVNGADHRPIQLGLAVDGVEEVCHFAPDDIEATPEFGEVIDTTCILGMAKVKGAVKTLLNIDRVVCGLLPGT
jgi:CheY-like chemotaxis protein